MSASALGGRWLQRAVGRRPRRASRFAAPDAEADLVELVSSAYGELRLERGKDVSNREAVENFVASLDPAVVYRVEGEGAAQISHGRREVELLFDRAVEDWDSCEFKLDRVLRLGLDQVEAAGLCEARSPNGETQRFEFTTLWTFRHGTAHRIEAFPGRGFALG